jgi:hypothetical protein
VKKLEGIQKEEEEWNEIKRKSDEMEWMMKNKRKNKYERTRKNNTYRKCIEYICNT